MKRNIAFLLVLVLTLSIVGVGNVFAEPVTIERDGVTMVQLYSVVAELDMELIWEKETKQVTLGDDENIVVLTVGSTTINVNGQEIQISQEPILLNGRVYVPTDFIEMMFGASTLGSSVNGDIYDVSNAVLFELLQGNYESIYEDYLSEEAKKTTSIESLNDVFTQALEEVGSYQGILQSTDGTVQLQGEAYNALQHDILFSERGVRLVIIFDDANLIYGMNIEYFETNESDVPEGIIEEDIIIGEGTDFELKGKLTMPENAVNPLKAVVLVQGSGPSDMDETMGSYKLFRDLAWGLAQEGIAVIRYDKRTYTYGSQLTQEYLTDLTVKEEVIEDALLATELLRQDERIDSENIYLAGHSLGGKLSFRIDAEEGGDYAGIISLAGTTRSMWETMRDQLVDASKNEYVATTDDIKLQYEQIIEEMESFGDITKMSDTEAKEKTFMGTGMYYFTDLEKTDDAALAKKFQKPILVLQGKDDYQVLADKDYVILKELLAGNKNAQFILYDKVNHLFAENTGTLTKSSLDYISAKNVYPNVIQDIAKFIISN